MKWYELLTLISEEVGADAARRIEDRARLELGGTRLTVGIRRRITREDVVAAAPGRVREAARRLHISPTTAYRRLVR